MPINPSELEEKKKEKIASVFIRFIYFLKKNKGKAFSIEEIEKALDYEPPSHGSGGGIQSQVTRVKSICDILEIECPIKSGCHNNEKHFYWKDLKFKAIE